MNGRRLRGETGQVLPLMAAGLAVVLLGLTALVLDIGNAYLAQRQLQAGADAAALAGAGMLPDAAVAAETASAYAADPANTPADLGPVGTTVTTRCLKSTPDCSPADPNVVSVTRRATVATTFARLLGIDSITVATRATATRSASARPLDVALVLDRTGSMDGQMPNLIAGATAFLDALDPTRDRVSLVVLPPSQGCDRYGRCDYYPADADYVLSPLTSDFAALSATIRSLDAKGSTSYKQALAAAAAELETDGRPDADKVIVFETDGAANAVPDDAYQQPLSWLGGRGSSIPYGYPASGRLDDIERPCGSAVDLASTIGIPVYTVGFHLSSDQTCYEAPYRTGRRSMVGYRQVREDGITSSTALQQMAVRSGGQAFLQEDGSKLAETFAQVARQLQPTRLVPDDS